MGLIKTQSRVEGDLTIIDFPATQKYKPIQIIKVVKKEADEKNKVPERYHYFIEYERIYSREEYIETLVKEIRKKYSQDDEFMILRKKDREPELYEAYDTYVENLKTQLKTKMGLL